MMKFIIQLQRVHVNSHVLSRGPDRGQLPKRRLLIHATKVAYPKVHPCFFDFLAVRRLASHNRASRYYSQIVTRHLLHSSELIQVCVQKSHYSPYKSSTRCLLNHLAITSILAKYQDHSG